MQGRGDNHGPASSNGRSGTPATRITWQRQRKPLSPTRARVIFCAVMLPIPSINSSRLIGSVPRSTPTVATGGTESIESITLTEGYSLRTPPVNSAQASNRPHANR